MIRRLSRVADSSSPRYEPLRRPRKDQRPASSSAAAAEGHVPVYVGEEMVRFEVRAELLNRPAFVELLRRSAQEYGYEQRGVLRIPCSVALFRRVLAASTSDAFAAGGNQQQQQEEEEEFLVSAFDGGFVLSSA